MYIKHITRETHTIEENAEGLVKLLEVCHAHNLKPVGKDADPPHAKIAADIMSCLFMVCFVVQYKTH